MKDKPGKTIEVLALVSVSKQVDTNVEIAIIATCFLA